jgi:hypothetical protein
MEKNGEYKPEKDNEAQKNLQKKVYKPIEKEAEVDWGLGENYTSVSEFTRNKEGDK